MELAHEAYEDRSDSKPEPGKSTYAISQPQRQAGEQQDDDRGAQGEHRQGADRLSGATADPTHQGRSHRRRPASWESVEVAPSISTDPRAPLRAVCGSLARACRPTPHPKRRPLRPAPAPRLESLLWRIDPMWVSVALFVLGLVVYLGSNPERHDLYDHFVWQADAFLQGRAEIEYPVVDGPYQNGFFQDVLPVAPDRAQIPFPPLPAVVLMPFVAMWGLGTNGAAVAAVLGALNVVLCWVMLLGVTPRRSAALLGTLFYAFGTVAWYAAMLGTTWFLAHVVASTFLFIAIAIAVRADSAAVRARASGGGQAVGRQFAAGLALGAAATARLTTIAAAPFFVFVGGGRSWLERAVAAGIGALIPVLLLLGYNLVTTGELSSTPPTTFSTRSSSGPDRSW